MAFWKRKQEEFHRTDGGRADLVVNALTHRVLLTFLPLNEPEQPEVKLNSVTKMILRLLLSLLWVVEGRNIVMTVGQQAPHFHLTGNMTVASESRGL